MVVGIHLYETEEQRLAQARVVMEHFFAAPIPVILAGDFNSEPGTAIVDLLAKAWDPIPKSGPTFTFPADEPIQGIDSIMLKTSQRVRAAQLTVIEEPLVSDHRPLMLELWLE